MVKIASIGDVCVDAYPQTNKFILGGTAFNRAKWLARNGVNVSLVSAVGTDDWGKKYLNECRRLNINTDYLSILPGSTSHVEIALDKSQSPHFSAWQLGALKNFYPKIWPKNQDALITTGLKPIRQLLNLPPAPLTAADFDGTTPYTFTSAAIKPYAPRFDLVIASRKLQLNHPMVLTTLGEQGSRLITPKKTYFTPAVKTKTADTTGAGDVYIAAFVLNYLKTKNIRTSMKQATQTAAKAITLQRN